MIIRRIIIGAVTMALMSPAQSPAMDMSIYYVPVSGNSSKVYSETRSRYILYSSHGDFSLPETPSQRVVSTKRKAGGVEITVEAGEGVSASDALPAQFLSDTRLLGIRSPEITRLGEKFIGSRNPLQSVTRFVYDYITEKTLGVPIISAREILKSRTGDCTEHTVLTVAILRAMRIPCRAVVGMILAERFQGAGNVFVFHMWAEAHLGGRWMLADSTRPGTFNYNRYIAFAYHNLRAEMPLEYLSAVSAIRDLSVHYQDR